MILYETRICKFRFLGNKKLVQLLFFLTLQSIKHKDRNNSN